VCVNVYNALKAMVLRLGGNYLFVSADWEAGNLKMTRVNA
jgi:hypothetical protein